MDETIKIKCPCCESVLVIRRRDGKLLETREPILKESTGDRFEDVFEKVRGRSKEVENKVAEARRKEQERLKGADDFFKQALERAKNSDDELHNPMDSTDHSYRRHLDGFLLYLVFCQQDAGGTFQVNVSNISTSFLAEC